MRPRYVLPKLTCAQMIDQLDVGKNTAIVAEVFKLVTSGRLLKPIEAFTGNYPVITDYNKAEELAYYTEVGEPGYLWTDIFSLEISNITCEKYPEGVEEPKDLTGEMYSELEKNLDKKYLENSIDDIYSNLCEILEFRMKQGKNHAFLASLFVIYKQGCWPCGWEGNYSDGKIIVYQPPIESKK